MPSTPAPAELDPAIRRLKREMNAVILSHYYQESDIQDVADFVGDSLALAQEAASTTAEVIVFCGVHFMAETAKIVNPDATGLAPRPRRRLLASLTGAPPAAFAAFKAKHPGAFVITYVNSSAEVKAMSDVICTSSNALKMVEKSPKDRPILFAPDQHLGRWVQRSRPAASSSSGRGAASSTRSSARSCWSSFKSRHPEAEVIAHPECEEPVLSPRRLHRFDEEHPRPRPEQPEEGVHRRHRGGNSPPDAEAGCRRRPSSPHHRTMAAAATSVRT